MGKRSPGDLVLDGRGTVMRDRGISEGTVGMRESLRRAGHREALEVAPPNPLRPSVHAAGYGPPCGGRGGPDVDA